MENSYQTKLESFYRDNKRMPTYSEMMKLFGFKSKNAIFKIVEKLIDGGVVTKDHLGRLLPSEIFNEIPKLGYVKAGIPAEAEELTDRVNLDDLLVGLAGLPGDHPVHPLAHLHDLLGLDLAG